MILTEAVDRFISDQSQRSVHTQRAYRLALTKLCSFAGPDMQVSELSPDHILNCVRAMTGSDLSANSLMSYTSGMTQFAHWLILEGAVTFGLVDYDRLRERLRGILGRRVSRRLPHIPSDDAVRRILAAARGVKPTTTRLAIIRARDIALLETLRSTGARVSEIVGLKVKDLIGGETMGAMVMGKGQKERMIFFDNVAWAAIQTYLALRDDAVTNGQPVFARHDRQAKGLIHMAAGSVRDIITEYAELAGVEEHVHPHAFRHRLAYKVLTATGNLAATQDLLGHSSPQTTRVYARLTTDNLRQAHAVSGV